jgi:ATP synthase protein I
MNKSQLTSKERRKVIAESFTKRVGTREALRIRGRKEKDQNIWFGLGMIGVVGWAVTIPTLIGVAIGLWIDRTWPSRFSWTMTLLISGVMVGCMNAWYWVRRGGTPTEPKEKG